MIPLPWLASLRVRFLLLVLVAVLPALGLLLWTAAEQRELAVAEAQEDARRLAALAAADQDRQIGATRQLLTVLARLPEVQGAIGDPGACTALLRGLLGTLPLYGNLGVIAPDGALPCSAVEPNPGTNLGDRAYFRRAVETKDFAVGEHQIGRVTGKATLNCAYPILEPTGAVRAVVYAAIDLEQLNRFVADAGFAGDATLMVVDRAGTVLVRHPDPTEWVGRSVRGTPVVEAILAGRGGVAEADDEEGRAQLWAHQPLGANTPPDAFLAVALPRARAVAAAERTFNDSVTRLGLVAALILVAAWVGGDLLVRRDVEAHKALVRRLYEAFATGGVDLLDDVVAPGFVDHDPAQGQAPGVAGLKQAVGLFRAAFPDGRLTVEELVAEGDRVVARVTLRGTHAGEFFGAPPSGRPVTAEGIETFRVVGGKLAEAWSRFGALVPVPGAEEARGREGAEARATGEGARVPAGAGGAGGAPRAGAAGDGEARGAAAG